MTKHVWLLIIKKCIITIYDWEKYLFILPYLGCKCSEFMLWIQISIDVIFINIFRT